MNTHRVVLCPLILVSLSTFAQSKGEMPFTSSSPNSNKLLRNAWVALGDFRIEDANRYTRQVLEQDPDCAMAYVSLFSENDEEIQQNISKAETSKISEDEKLFIDAIKARKENESNHEYFEPLMRKYPSDYYLHLWAMYNNSDRKKAIQIGEMIIRKNPKFAPAYNMLGYLYMDKKEMTIAENHFNKYLSLRPNLANPYDSKADYFMRVGKIAEAIPLYEKAAEMGMTPSKGRADVAKAKLKYSGPSSDDMQEIRNIIRATSEAHLKGDVDEILKYYAEQSMEIFPNQVVNAGIANIRSRLEETFNYGSFTMLNRSVDFIEGAGPIALAWGRTKGAFKSGSTGQINESEGSDIFLLRKQKDNKWKVLAHHWITGKEDVSGQESKDSSDIREVIDKWSFFMKPGEVFTQEHVEKLANIHSSQAIDILPNQRSIIGIANLRLRWTGFLGITWAQFTEVNFDINSFATIGADGLSRRAVAWGIGDHSHYPNGSDHISKFLYPWAMILTKEDDGHWRVLVYHFFVG